MKNLHFIFFLIISIIKEIYSDKSMTIYLALESELKQILINGETQKILSYTQNELSDINLIKKFTFSYNSSLKINITTSLENSTLAAFIINNDASDSFYFSSSFSNWKCNGTELNFISLVRDYIWYKNKRIPPLASVIQCINGTDFYFSEQ